MNFKILALVFVIIVAGYFIFSSGTISGMFLDDSDENEITDEVFLFDMADFMGDDHIKFIRFQQMQQGLGYQYVTEIFYEAHDTSGDHLSAEYRPLKNIFIF